MKPYREPLSISSSYREPYAHVSLWNRFINWCAEQEERRFLWLGLAIVGHGCVITILTLFGIMFSGNNLTFWLLVMSVMVACLVVNLAALPTKITIPVFFISVLIDVTILALCIAHGINLNSIFNR
jgi:hypothetical protein